MSRMFGSVGVKARGLVWGLDSMLCELRGGEEGGLPSVAVKCVVIRKHTGSDGGFLDCN